MQPIDYDCKFPGLSSKREVGTMKKLTIFAIIVLVFAINLAFSVHKDADEEGIRNAVLDYVEALYEVQPERIALSVDVTLRKYGYGYNKREGKYRNGSEMNYKQLVNLAATWNRKGSVDAKTAPKKITILDHLDKTASAKLSASWGVDYFHLSKEDGKWKIINVLWQGNGPDTPRE